MIKRILVPVDFSKPSLQALEYAIELGRSFTPEFLVTHVIDPIAFTPPTSPFGEVADMGLVFDELQRAGKEQLARLATDLRKRKITVRTLLQVGTPYHVIVDTAKKLRADLIIMATHGRTGFSHLMMGSVAEKVVRTAGCPVLTVRGYTRSGARSQRRPTRATRK